LSSGILAGDANFVGCLEQVMIEDASVCSELSFSMPNSLFFHVHDVMKKGLRAMWTTRPSNIVYVNFVGSAMSQN
jgi:hypothetical protein